MKRIYPILVITFSCLANLVFSQADLTYQEPPKAIADLVKAPQTPAVSINPEGTWMVLMDRAGYPSIEELAQPELRIAGLRINPRTNGPSRSSSYTGLTFKSVLNGRDVAVTGLPDKPQIENVSWSPDGEKIVFTINKNNGIELWIASISSGEARKLTDAVINDAMGGRPYRWIGSKKILYKAVPPNRGDAPAKPLAPKGPVVQESTGTKAPVRTYQDLLQNQYDEALFDYYATAQLYLLDLDNGSQAPFGEAGIYSQVSPSPSGEYIFLTQIECPIPILYLTAGLRKKLLFMIYRETRLKSLLIYPWLKTYPKASEPSGWAPGTLPGGRINLPLYTGSKHRTKAIPTKKPTSVTRRFSWMHLSMEKKVGISRLS